MTTDTFLEALRSDWQANRADTDALEATFLRRRRRALLSLAASGVGIAVVAVGFVGLSWLAWRERGAGQFIACLAFAVALPLIVLGFVEQTRNWGRFDKAYSEHVLSFLRGQLLMTRQRLWGARACVIILIAAATALFVATIAGASSVREGAIAATTWLVTAYLVWLWQRRRDVQLTLEISNCDRLIAEFETNQDDGG